MGTLIKDGGEVKMVATHVFISFQSCCNLEFLSFTDLKTHTERSKTSMLWNQKHIHTWPKKYTMETITHTHRDIKQAYCGNKHTHSHTHKTSKHTGATLF